MKLEELEKLSVARFDDRIVKRDPQRTWRFFNDSLITDGYDVNDILNEDMWDYVFSEPDFDTVYKSEIRKAKITSISADGEIRINGHWMTASDFNNTWRAL